MPEILEVELYRASAEAALDRPITRAWMVDSRYGRGGTTPARLRAALVGRSFSAARRIGKLLLLETDGGPTLGLRFGMTGGLVVDGNEALDRLRYGPGVFNEKWVRARITFQDGGDLLMHDPRRFGSLELAPDEGRLGPDALTVSLADPEWRRRSRRALWTRNGWPAWATSWPTRSSTGPGSHRTGGRRSPMRRSANCTSSCDPRCASWAGEAARTWAT
jgi:formamidopyrimidine-DNA glycosylase